LTTGGHRGFIMSLHRCYFTHDKQEDSLIQTLNTVVGIAQRFI
jgi:hypothetical protein